MNTFRVLLFFGFILLLASCGNNKTLKISGQITNAPQKTLLLQELGISNVITLDSIELSNKGAFKFKLPKIEYPKFFLLKLSEDNFITLLADSTEQIEVIAEGNDLAGSYTVKNSLGSKYVKVLNTKLNKTKAAVDSLANLYNQYIETDKEQAEKIKLQVAKVVEDQKDFINDFVMSNPKSFASYYAIFQRYNNGNLVLDPYQKKDLILFNTVATSMDVYYPKSPRSEQLKNFVLGIQKDIRNTKLKEQLMQNETMSFPDLEVENLNGEKIKLSSLKGKMVLLSFWASWDKKSRAENKNLIETYNKYKSKGFEVYQVSLDKSKLLWEEAVKQDKLPWISVSDLQFTDSYPARIYNVQQLPANYLISKKGDLIGKDLFGRILDEKLNDLLN